MCIITEDLEKTSDFYCGLLGLQKKYEFKKDGESVGMYLEAGQGTFIEVFKREVSGEDTSNIVHFCFEVDDIETAAEKFNKAGVVTADKKMGKDGSWQIWIKDPNNIKIELQEYTDKSSQITGDDCNL